jgi:DNA-binding NtrC family response regulator
MSRNVLVLETDRATRSLFVEWLAGEGWQVVDASSADAAAPLSLIVLELAFLRDDGLQPLAEAKLRYPGVPIIVVSPQSSPASAAAALARSLWASPACCPSQSRVRR